MGKQKCVECKKKFDNEYEMQTPLCSKECRTKHNTGTCENCGKEYVKVRKERRFCSSKCAGIFNTQHTRLKPKRCEYCEQSFKPTIRKQRFCSVECGTANRTSDKNHVCVVCQKSFHRPYEMKTPICSKECRKKQYPTTCERCKKQFFPKYSTARFCSMECSHPRRQDKQCKHCGTTFTPNHSHDSFCSMDCAFKHLPEHYYEKSTRQYSKKILKCEACGKDFYKRYQGANRFCSRQCSHKLGPQIRKEGTCIGCGKDFTKRDYRNVYCSRSCSNRHRELLRIERSQKNCKECGSQFMAKDPRTQFCSIPCYRTHRKRSYQTPVICEHCGQTFNKKPYGFNRFCSRKCSDVSHAKFTPRRDTLMFA